MIDGSFIQDYGPFAANALRLTTGTELVNEDLPGFCPVIVIMTGIPSVLIW